MDSSLPTRKGADERSPMSKFASIGPWSNARKSVSPRRASVDRLRGLPPDPAGAAAREKMSRGFFSFSKHRRRDYDPSGAHVKDILPLLRTARVGERRPIFEGMNGASATSSLRPGPRVEAGAAASRDRPAAGSAQRDRGRQHAEERAASRRALPASPVMLDPLA